MTWECLSAASFPATATTCFFADSQSPTLHSPTPYRRQWSAAGTMRWPLTSVRYAHLTHLSSFISSFVGLLPLPLILSASYFRIAVHL